MGLEDISNIQPRDESGETSGAICPFYKLYSFLDDEYMRIECYHDCNRNEGCGLDQLRFIELERKYFRVEENEKP